MPTLLKDMPEHAEKIEGNYSLIGKIKDELMDATIVDSRGHQNFGGRVEFPESVAVNILKEVAEFINTNYTWKGDKV